MTLPSVRRIPDHQAGLQNRPGCGATAAGYGGVDDAHARIFSFVLIKQRVESRYLAARGPPGEDLDLSQRRLDELTGKKTARCQLGRSAQLRNGKLYEFLSPLIAGTSGHIEVKSPGE